MQINPEKVLDAIAVLKASALVLFNAGDQALSDRCLEVAQALHESTVIAGVSNRMFHSTGN